LPGLLSKFLSLKNTLKVMAFTGIWIPVEICLCNGFDAQEKIIVGQVIGFKEAKKPCYVSNNYFASILGGLSAKRVSTIINGLIAKGVIQSTLNKESGNMRVLELNESGLKAFLAKYPIPENGNTIPENFHTLSPKTGIPYPRKQGYPIPENRDTLSPKTSTNNKENNKVDNIIESVCKNEFLQPRTHKPQTIEEAFGDYEATEQQQEKNLPTLNAKAQTGANTPRVGRGGVKNTLSQFVPPNEAECFDFFKAAAPGLPEYFLKSEATKFYNYYEARGWAGIVNAEALAVSWARADRFKKDAEAHRPAAASFVEQVREDAQRRGLKIFGAGSF
jgi:hypothetical protein